MLSVRNRDRANQVRQTQRETIAALFEAGKDGQAVARRRERCNTAARCRGWCRWLVMGVGVSQAACAHPDQGERPADLTAMLSDPAAHCPDGRW